MDAMRHELANINAVPAPAHAAHAPAPGQAHWAAEFDPNEQARMDAAFPAPAMQNPSFSSAEFAQFHQHQTPAAAAPVTATNAAPMAGMYQRPMGMGGYGGMGMMGMMRPTMGPMAMQQQGPADAQLDKGKGRMVELDDQNWEAQFAEMDAAGQQSLDDQANAAMEAELDDIDRSVYNGQHYLGAQESDARPSYKKPYESVWLRVQAERRAAAKYRKLAQGELNLDDLNTGDVKDWEGFDDSLAHKSLDGPHFGDYLFEQENAFNTVANPFEEGVKIMREHGNLSLAALAFEAAVQKDTDHVEAWVMLGAAQAQNEKTMSTPHNLRYPL
ncbi:hypothetical protein KEM56_005043 [Ascosphaera pollenicola]|nr:hypothetical protein KEM56_005043 [Ascosphaera pollenicola]